MTPCGRSWMNDKAQTVAGAMEHMDRTWTASAVDQHLDEGTRP